MDWRIQFVFSSFPFELIDMFRMLANVKLKTSTFWKSILLVLSFLDHTFSFNRFLFTFLAMNLHMAFVIRIHKPNESFIEKSYKKIVCQRKENWIKTLIFCIHGWFERRVIFGPSFQWNNFSFSIDNVSPFVNGLHFNRFIDPQTMVRFVLTLKLWFDICKWFQLDDSSVA